MASSKRFEDLPLEARARGSKLLEVLPELRDTIANLYPDEATSRKVVEERRARELAEQEARKRGRHVLCDRALAGDFGRDVKRAAKAAYDAAGELTPTTVQKIIDLIKEHERAKRSRQKKGR